MIEDGTHWASSWPAPQGPGYRLELSRQAGAALPGRVGATLEDGSSPPASRRRQFGVGRAVRSLSGI